jgi:NAD(P)-dependent dehydrogenase (short-subunit alcohol dehydrogenase family)
MARVLVAGGAGGVGEGIVRSLLLAAHVVIVPSRSDAKLDLLRGRLEDIAPAERLETVVAQIGEPAGAERLRDQLASGGERVHAVIASLGGWWDGGKLIDMQPADWDRVMDETLRTHFVVARTFVPMLQRQGGGRYIAIGGGAAIAPIPGAAVISIAGAAQLMLTRALRAEVDDPAVDIFELVIDGPVRTRHSEELALPGWIELQEIGRIVVDLVAAGRTHDPRAAGDGPIITMRSLSTREIPGWHG